MAAEWGEQGDRRPFVGALTLELPTDADEEALSWITAGTPPIYFGFGSNAASHHPARHGRRDQRGLHQLASQR